jgi:hypothetical protein
LTLLIGRRLFWEVDAVGIIEVPDAGSAGGTLISLDLHDHRLACARPRSSRRGRRHFMQEWGEQVRLADLSRELHAQYGRDPRHGPPRPPGCRLYSGLQLMDRLAQARGLAPGPRLLGLRLGVVEGPGRSLVLLFAYDGRGELLKFQEAANPPNLAYLVEDFSRGLGESGAVPEVAWFGHAEVLAALPTLRPYPDEDLLLGTPLPLWWARAARASWSLVMLSLLSALMLGWDLWCLRARLAEDATQALALQARLDRSLATRVHALARISSAPISMSFHDAEALWQPGSRVRVQVRASQTDYALRIDGAAENKLVRDGESAAKASGGLRAALEQRAGRTLPPGVRSLDPAASGDLNDYYLRFQRSTPLPVLAALAGAEP